MANVDLIFQAAQNVQHVPALDRLLTLGGSTDLLLSVAFVRRSGVDAISAPLKAVAGKTRAFVGIRNEITSIQGISRLMDLGVSVFAVDTGARHVIFHPKLYLARSATNAECIVGSANLTFAGLNNNIEISARMRLDLAIAEDAAFVTQTFDGFAQLIANYPQHVIPVSSVAVLKDLFDTGRLEDEDVVPAPSARSSLKGGKDRDPLGRMKLHFKAPPPPTAPAAKAAKKVTAKAPVKTTVAAPSAAIPAPAVPAASAMPGFYEVWRSNELKERDLNVPKGTNTNPTGSIGLKKGTYSDIDQRHYFRDDVFARLAWWKEKPTDMIERAEAEFELVIKNVSYGQFTLRLSHNTDTTTKSYAQGNMMTQLHWGPAKPHVAKDDLLGRTLFLYRRDSTPPVFLIEVD